MPHQQSSKAMQQRCSSWLLLLLIAAILLPGCKQRNTPDPQQLRPAAGGRWYGGIYRVNETGELRSLDPVAINDVTSAHIAENIYDQLLYFDEQLHLTPELPSDGKSRQMAAVTRITSDEVCTSTMIPAFLAVKDASLLPRMLPIH